MVVQQAVLQQAVLQQVLRRLRVRGVLPAVPLEELRVVLLEELRVVLLEERQVVPRAVLQVAPREELRAAQRLVALLLERQLEPQELLLRRQVLLEPLLQVLA